MGVRGVLRLFLFGGVLFLAACGTLGPGPGNGPVPIEKEPEHTDVDKPVTPVKPSRPVQPSVSGAAHSLMNKADVVSGSGDYEQALALLERAQRINPGSGEIYLSLAVTYSAKGDQSMARAAAERGMLYCRGASQCSALRAFTPPGVK